MNREETILKIVAQVEKLNHEQLELLNLYLDALERELKAAKKPEYPDMITDPEFYIKFMESQK